jgi:hypothetical protein
MVGLLEVAITALQAGSGLRIEGLPGCGVVAYSDAALLPCPTVLLVVRSRLSSGPR